MSGVREAEGDSSVNQFMVGSNGDCVVVGVAVQGKRLTKDEAINLAVWICAVAGVDEDEFREAFEEEVGR